MLEFYLKLPFSEQSGCTYDKFRNAQSIPYQPGEQILAPVIELHV